MDNTYANEIVEQLNEINDALKGESVSEETKYANPIASALGEIKKNVNSGGGSGGGDNEIEITQGQSGFSLVTPFNTVLEYAKTGAITVKMSVDGEIVNTLYNCDSSISVDETIIYLDKIRSTGIYTNPKTIRINAFRFTLNSNSSVEVAMASASISAT